MDVHYAKELFDYDEDTGVMRWRRRPERHFSSKKAFLFWNTRYAGKDITGVGAQGYCRVCVDRVKYLAHRVVWLINYGDWPEGQIDHINGVRTDNRLSNLRCVAPSGNARNQGMKSTNKSGVSGVSWCKRTQKWQASITVNYKTKFLGRFSCIKDAELARNNAKAKYKFHNNHGDKR